jgi:hypothetical protein
MALNYHGKKFLNNWPLNTAIIYCGAVVIYCGVLTLENVGTAVIYCGSFFY